MAMQNSDSHYPSSKRNNNVDKPLLIFDRTRLCESIRSYGQCQRVDNKCRHAHDIDEVRSTLHVFRTRDCMKKPCYANFMCRGAHVPGEVELVKRLIDNAILPTVDGCIKHSDYLRLLRDLGSIGKDSGYSFMELVEEVRSYYDIRSREYDSDVVFYKHIQAMKEDERNCKFGRALNHRRMLLDVLLARDPKEEEDYVLRCNATFAEHERYRSGKPQQQTDLNNNIARESEETAFRGVYASSALQSQSSSLNSAWTADLVQQPSFPVVPAPNMNYTAHTPQLLIQQPSFPIDLRQHTDRPHHSYIQAPTLMYQGNAGDPKHMHMTLPEWSHL